MTQRTRGKGEKIFIAALLIISAVAFSMSWQAKNKVAKEEALISELLAVRTAVQLYVTMNNKLPESLNVLTTQKYYLGGKSGIYLTGVAVDSTGYPLNAFGDKFNYDPSTGWVSSGTLVASNYQGW